MTACSTRLSEEDATVLQKALDQLQQWEQDWQMKFNPDNSKVICTTNKHKVINTEQQLQDTITRFSNKPAKPDIWASTSTAPYYGICTWLQFPRKQTALCLSSKGIYLHVRRMSRLPATSPWCAPQLEYGSSVWDPPTMSNINKLEAVQCHAARFCHSDYRRTSSVTAMMEDLGWEQLQTHRQQVKTIILYRIVNQLVDIQTASLLMPAGTHTRGHANRFQVPYCSINAYKYSFYPSSIRLWNSLPAALTTSPFLDVFMARTDVIAP